VRRFGRFSRSGEIEAVVVDDRLGYVFYSDEGSAIRKYHADPDHADAAAELAAFGTQGSIVTMSDSTDGLEATSRALPGFPQGLLVMMNSRDKNFLIYDWRDIQPR